jgi:hypothetical protein
MDYNLHDPEAQVYRFTGDEQILIGEDKYTLKGLIDRHNRMKWDLRAVRLLQVLTILIILAYVHGW